MTGGGLPGGVLAELGMGESVEELPGGEVKPPGGSNWVGVGWRGGSVVQGWWPAMVAVGVFCEGKGRRGGLASKECAQRLGELGRTRPGQLGQGWFGRRRGQVAS